MSYQTTEHETLFAAVCDGKASVAQQRELTERLAGDAAVRDQYLAYVDLHAQLATEPAVGELAGDHSSPNASQRSNLLETKQRESNMSKNIQTTGDARWTVYGTAVCVLVLIGSGFAMYSMSGLKRGEEVASRYSVDDDIQYFGMKRPDFVTVTEGEELERAKDGVDENNNNVLMYTARGNGLGKKQDENHEAQKLYWRWTAKPGEGKHSGQTVDSIAGIVVLSDGKLATGEGQGKGNHTYEYEGEVDALKSRVVDKLAALGPTVGDGTTALHRHLRLELTEAEESDRTVVAIVDASESMNRGEGRGRDRYSRIIENAFKGVVDHPLSTFSIDVDTASYANTRQYLMQSSSLPPADAVRIEEMVNYFDYAYAVPKGDDPFASHIEVAACPWQPKHRLVRVALKGKEIDRKERPKSNLVFLVDVSGSMNNENKLGLVKKGLKLLTKELGKNDQVAMVVYAGAAGLVLDSTVGYEKETINAAIDKLDAGGSTAGGAGIKLAYETAVDNFIRGGVNRVILCTDGDFNVGLSGNAELEKMAEDQAKSGVFLSVMGFGRGNLNDAMMERITNKGNGNYAYIDTTNEAKKVFVEQMSGTLVTIAKDVKIQIEFNPAAVAGYRLIGYENRLLAKEDFNDDTKDAGEIGAGHTVTALYEIVPAGEKIPTPDVDDLKYQKPTSLTKASKSGEMLTLKLRYKQPDGEKSKLLEFPVKDSGKKADAASGDFKFASAVASFSMLLRGSKYAGDADYDSVLKLADAGKGDDAHGYRAEFINMVKQAKKVDKRP